jgi:hypothetical protein
VGKLNSVQNNCGIDINTSQVGTDEMLTFYWLAQGAGATVRVFHVMSTSFSRKTK